MTLAAVQGTQLMIEADGPDAQQALDAWPNCSPATLRNTNKTKTKPTRAETRHAQQVTCVPEVQPTRRRRCRRSASGVGQLSNVIVRCARARNRARRCAAIVPRQPNTDPMQRLQGIAVSPGVAIGEAVVMDNEGFRIPRRFVSRDAVDDELERLEKAMAAAAAEIERNRDAVATELGEQYGAIFDAHLQMLTDPKLRAELESMIRERHYSPEYAVSRTLRRYAKVFQASGGTLAERASDIFDIEKRLLAEPAGPAPRRAIATDFAGRDPGPQSHAQRNRQSGSQVRPRLRHRSRRAGQPHRDRGRRAWKFRPSSAPGRF